MIGLNGVPDFCFLLYNDFVVESHTKIKFILGYIKLLGVISSQNMHVLEIIIDLKNYCGFV